MIENQFLQEIESPQEEEKKQYKKLMEEKSKELACPNEHCELYGIIGKDNILFRRKYGKRSSQNLFVCKICKKTFSERKGTPFFGFHLPEEKIITIIRCLVEGNGTRATARICNVHRDTVTKIIRRFGTHSEQVSRLFLKNYPLKECQLDEMWSFIKKTKKFNRT